MRKILLVLLIILLTAVLIISCKAGNENPVGSWNSMSSTALDARGRGVTHWTGTQMIIWGGDGSNGSFDSGALYNPSTDVWAPITSAPPSHSDGRTDLYNFKQSFTGNYMLYWGGRSVSGGSYYGGGTSTTEYTGAIYNVNLDTWTETKTIGTPAGWGGRAYLHGLWTGTDFIIWGGSDGHEHSGGSVSIGINDDTPAQIFNAGADWSVASDDSWSQLSESGDILKQRKHAVVIWTGSKILVWGGMFDDSNYRTDGSVYDSTTDIWTAMAASPLAGRRFPAYIWTGTKLLIWGGLKDGNPPIIYGDGAIYDPTANNWTIMSTTDAPSARAYITNAIWTGNNMVILGGTSIDDTMQFSFFTDGAFYNPDTDSWVSIDLSSQFPATGVGSSQIVFTGTKILMWGGMTNSGSGISYLNSGAILELNNQFYQ
jgi:hypothetical protein